MGKPTNVQAVKIVYAFLCDVIDNESKEAFKHYTGWEHGKTYCNSFRLGMVSRIKERLKLEKAKINEEIKALGNGNTTNKEIVVRDVFKEAQEEIQKYYKTIGLKLISSGYSGTNRSNSGYSTGYKAGANVPLHASRSLSQKN